MLAGDDEAVGFAWESACCGCFDVGAFLLHGDVGRGIESANEGREKGGTEGKDAGGGFLT